MEPALLGLFIDRLSAAAQQRFIAHFFATTGLREHALHNALLPPLFPPAWLSHKLTEEAVVVKLMHRRFPADFALYLFPEFCHLQKIVSSTQVNTETAHSYFEKLLLETFGEASHARDNLFYRWLPEERRLTIMPLYWADADMLCLTYDDPATSHLTPVPLLAAHRVEVTHVQSVDPVVDLFGDLFIPQRHFKRSVLNKSHRQLAAPS